MRTLLSSASLSILVVSAALGQLANQTALVGTVVDTSGSVIPEAQVVAVNRESRDTYRAATNGQGYYNIQFIRIGTYDITISRPGFQTFKASGIKVDTNQIVRNDVTLNVGDVAQSVTVEAAAAVIATDEARVAETLHQRVVAELPISGRNVWSLASTTPGVLAGTSSFTGAGQRNIQNSISLDGIGASQNLLTSTTMRPSVDSITEVQVQTGSTSAEYGAYLGVRINVVTKSGTNSLHGSIFEFLRNEKLDARGYFNSSTAPKNPLRQNQFGFEVDGPIVFPKLYNGRNKTFFMGTYEGSRQVSSSSSLSATLTPKMRAGDFSEAAANVVVRNPTRAGSPVYPDRIIPRSDQSPIALKVLQYLPLPNLPGTAQNLLGVSQSRNEADQGLGRVDQNLGDKVRLYFRYNWQRSPSVSLPANVFNGNTTVDRNRNILAAYTHILSPSLVNDFRTGYHYTTNSTENYFKTHDLNTAGADLGIPGFDIDVKDHNPGTPDFNITGFSGLGSGGSNWYQNDSIFQVTNVTAWTRQSHNIRFGGELRRLATGRSAVNSPRGIFNFNGQLTGYAPADFMLGLPQSVTTPGPQLRGRMAAWRDGFFINDTWQVSRKLTVNIGLRYDLPTVPYTATGYASILNREQSAILPANPPVPGFKLLLEPNHKDWAPRVGLAYRVTSKTVIRSGFGIYYNPNQTNTFTFLNTNPPFSPVFSFSSQPSNPTLSLLSPTPASGPTSTTPPNFTTPAAKLPDARMYQWSLDLQREIWRNAAIDFQYLGSNTIHLDRSYFNNTPLPGPGDVNARRPNRNFTVIRTITNDINASYNALSIVLRQRMSHGLEVLAHYTWAHTLDFSNNSNASDRNTQDPYNWRADHGNANWDYRHRFVATFVYDLPFFGSTKNPLLKYPFGGWQVNGIGTIQGGQPFNVTIGGDVANTSSTPQRPNLIAPATADCRGGHLTNCITVSSFAQPLAFTYGNAGRNILRGPRLVNLDFSLFKNFPIRERVKFQFRAEFFNFTNTPHFSNPNGTFGTAAFGSIGSTSGANRQVQFGAKLLF
jgi:hypothetical protein